MMKSVVIRGKAPKPHNPVAKIVSTDPRFQERASKKDPFAYKRQKRVDIDYDD